MTDRVGQNYLSATLNLTIPKINIWTIRSPENGRDSSSRSVSVGGASIGDKTMVEAFQQLGLENVCFMASPIGDLLITLGCKQAMLRS